MEPVSRLLHCCLATARAARGRQERLETSLLGGEVRVEYDTPGVLPGRAEYNSLHWRPSTALIPRTIDPRI